MTEAPEITDADIRDWARATGRPVGVKGRVAAELRREYERVNREANAEPPAAAEDGGRAPEPAAAPAGPPPGAAPAAAGPAQAPERPPAGPGAAGPERPPAVPRSGARRLQDNLRTRWSRSGRGAKSRPRSRRPRGPRVVKDRISLAHLGEKLWETGARLTQPVNLPVSRALEWEAATAGPMLDGAIKDTLIDPIAQVAAKYQVVIEDLGSLILLPVFVAGLQLPANQPQRVELVSNPQDGTVSRVLVPYPLGAMRHQILLGGLRECIEMQADAHERLPEEVKQRQLEREQRREKLNEIIEMIFAPPPGPGDAAAAAAEEEAMRNARERLRGQ